ncbi:MAG TPA: peptidase S41, partial [Salinimicrobium catena]|nr:peptidase S41 [Salinimicrobium catena]
MILKKITPLLLATVFLFTACEKDDEALKENLTATEEKDKNNQEFGDIEVEQFVYKGMNDIYLYKADVPVLADDYFATTTEKNEFLAGFDSPESLFEDLKWSQDRFSFITDDYISLEESFKGISSSVAGMEFGIGRITNTNNIFGYLQYILPGSAAEEAGLKRGTVFTEVNGTKLTLNNFSDLLDADSFTINIGHVENGSLVMTDETVTLTHSQYTENPVLISKVLDVDGQKVGYLMYNSFTADFDDELNAAFGELKASGVNELILDLRYNGGGSVESAVDLASMITGQYEGEIFMKEQWNQKYQEYFESEAPESLLNRFNPQIRTQEAINSLN